MVKLIGMIDSKRGIFMNKIFIEDLSKNYNQEIISSFLVLQKDLRQGAKDWYIRLKLGDKTGSITANIWNNAQSISKSFLEGDVVKIKGFVGKFKDNFQVTVSRIRVMNKDEYDLTNYMISTLKDRDLLATQLFKYIDEIKDTQIKELLKSIFEDKEFFTKFINSPGAKGWHHNFIGGLLEHTISVAKLCKFTSGEYPVNTDILMAGAILHDIGKVFEYNIKTIIDFSDEGRLVGHICLGDRFVSKKVEMINNFSEETLIKIRHLILSHHGEYENASARLPQTIEAMILFFADNLDAQATGISQMMQETINNKSKWTEYCKIHNRYFYLG